MNQLLCVFQAMNMFRANQEKWSSIRARGKRAYIIDTTLRFGLMLGIVFSISEVIRQEPNWFISALISFSIAFSGGMLFSFSMWAVNEHEYKRHGQE